MNADRSDTLAHTVVAQFQAQVSRTPEALAIECQGTQLCFADLDRRSNRLACALLASGITSEDRVGVSLPRGMDLIVAYLAVLKAGAAYVPLDASYPLARLKYMIEDSRVRVILAAASDTPHLEALGPMILPVGSASEGETAPPPASWPVVRPNQLAYVIYTSGSTGRSKGVMVQHESIVHLVKETDYISLTPEDRVLQLSNASFDGSTFEIWGALLNGALLVIVPYQVSVTEAEFARCMGGPPSTLFLTTALFNQLGPTLKRAKTVLFGGERCDVRFVRRTLETGQVRHLTHVYGPTECTTFSSSFSVAERDLDGETLPIGKPIRRARWHVLDSDLQPVREGEVGELFIGGPGLARGYLFRPGLTAERFIPDPFGAAPGARLYRTGDLVRLLPGDHVEFHGRLDHQVKLRGFRIELGEIEAQLASHPAVQEALVLLRQDREEIQELVAYVICHLEGGQSEEDVIDHLRTHLRTMLPPHMVPAAFVCLERFPLNANGKIDRAALPPPDFRDVADARFIAPEAGTERVVAEVWQEVLRLSRIGVDADFLALGGHSLLAAKIAAALRPRLEIDLPAGALLRFPTVRALAGHIDDNRATLATRLAAVTREAHPGLAPLSSGQTRLWFLDKLHRGSAHYNIPYAFELEGTLDEAALTWALDRILARHESLRTYFVERDGVPYQVVRAPSAVRLPVDDLSHLPPPDRENQAREIRLREATAPFDLGVGPVLRGRLVRLGVRRALLLLTIHHIAADGWSIGVLLKELNALYASAVAGQEDPLPALEVQFVDYAVWERRWMASPLFEEQIAFWEARLRGSPTVHSLPTDRLRPESPSFAGRVLHRVLGPEATAGIRLLAQAHGATPFMVLSSAFSLLLSRWSHEKDIVLGVPVANRGTPTLAPLIGFFVNTLVWRFDLSNNVPFVELLERVKRESIEIDAHHRVPFDAVVERLGAARAHRIHPLFQILFAYHNNEFVELALPGLRCTSLQVDYTYSKFDLTLSMTESPAGFSAAWEYSTDLFDAETITEMIESFAVLLAELLRDANRPIEALGLVSEAQRERLLARGMPPAPAGDATRIVHHLFERQAARTPSAVAVAERDRTLTYAALDGRAEQLARQLEALSVMPGDVIGLCLDRSIEMVVGMLGILKAGAAYLPLDPTVPAERLCLMLEDARVNLLVARPEMVARLRGSRGTLTCLDPATLTDGVKDAGARPASRVTSEDLAYVIYTSGSTGRPKGVDMPHGVLTNLIWAMRDHYPGLSAPMSMIQFASLGFDMCFTDTFLTLSSGGRLLLIDPETYADPGLLRSVIAQHRVERLNFPFAALQALAALCVAQDQRLPALRQIISTAEQLKITPEIRRFFLQHEGCVLINHYGPSETHVITAHELAAPPQAWPFLPSIGRPLAGTTSFILDRDGALVPPGMIGELYVGGACVARGYRDRPRETAQRFVPDPFGGPPGGRLYRTGDRVRWRSDGVLEFHVRIDHQVKLRGFRIEPGEIESRLGTHEAVRESLVLLLEDRTGSQHLVAYVVYKGASPPDRSAFSRSLRAHLQQVLPSYMVPAAFVPLERFPLNANGKVDRAALPLPDFEEEAGAAFVGPATEAEQSVLEVWQGVLGVQRIGVNANFFDIGGHSLSAVKVAAALGARIKIELPVVALFTFPTIRGLAAHIEVLRGAAAPKMSEITQADRAQPLPLSSAQKRIWILQQTSAEPAGYNVPLVVELDGALQVEPFVRSVAVVLARHEAFRTTFSVEAGQLVQRIGQPVVPPIEVHEIGGFDAAERQERVGVLVRACATRAFDLAAGPLWVATLISEGSERARFVLCVHHILIDAWSFEIFFREVSEAYAAFLTGRTPELPTPPLHYADYARWEASQAGEREKENAFVYWQRQLDGLPGSSAFPADYERPTGGTSRGALASVLIEPPRLAEIEAFWKPFGTTAFMFFLSIYAALLFRYTGSNDLCIGVPVAGRHREETISMIGVFVNTLPLRIRFAEDASFSGLLATVRDALLEALSHQEMPFDDLVARINPARVGHQNPFFSTTFSLNPHLARELSLPGVTASTHYLDSGAAKLDLSVVCEYERAGLRVYAAYDSDLYDEESIERLLSFFQRVASAAIRQPEVPLAALVL